MEIIKIKNKFERLYTKYKILRNCELLKLPVVDESIISNYEKEFKVKIPNEIIMYYTKISGGGFGPDYGIAPIQNLVNRNFGELSHWELYDVVNSNKLNKLLMLISSGSGGYVCVSLSGAFAGKIVYINIQDDFQILIPQEDKGGINFFDWLNFIIDKADVNLESGINWFFNSNDIFSTNN